MINTPLTALWLRAGLATAVLLVSLTTVGAEWASATPVEAQAQGRVLSTDSVIPGERLKVAGTAPGDVRRPVVLQVRKGNRWANRTVRRTTQTGRYVFRLSAPARVAKYRVVGPAVRRDGTRLHRYVSAVRRVRPTEQSGVLTMPSVVRRGTRMNATARFAPARVGRRVSIQARRPSGWLTIGTTRQDARGRATIQVTGQATTTYRAVARRWKGAPAVVTAPRTVTVDGAPVGRTPWVTGYYAGWFWDQMYPPERVDMSAMTHFVFGRVAPGAGSLGGTRGEVVEGAGTAHDPGLAPDGVSSVEDYLVGRAHAQGTRALLMLGGDGLDGRGFMLSTTDAERSTFVENVVDYLVEHDYDGVDVDWENCLSGEVDCGEPPGEPPVGAAEARRRLSALIADLRTETAERARYAAEPALITFPGYPLNMNDVRDGRAEAWQADIAKAVDQYNLMSYGVGTTWWGHGTGWESWFSGALFGHSPSTPVDIASSVDAYVAAGVPRERIGIGIGFYGIYYGPAIDGPRQYTPDNDIYEVQDVPLRYSELVRKGYLSHGDRRWDVDAASTYRIYPGAGFIPESDPGANPAGMLSYEDEQSIAAKGDWVRDTGVGGTILWTLNYGYLPDTRTNPLLDQVKASFLGPEGP